MSLQIVSNLPNPGKLIESLRHLGYDNYAALADLIDNCFDAEAKNVHVVIRQEKKEPVIYVADDGYGMDRQTLDEAMKLGSLTERNPSVDLGKFGMGLSTATLSICRWTEVLTRTDAAAVLDDPEGGQLLKSVTDLDEIAEANKFQKYLGEAEKSDEGLWSELLGESWSGTVVVMRKCDNLQNTNLTVFGDTLRRKVGQVFRTFLVSGKKITVNGKVVVPYDPMMLEENAEVWFDDTIPVRLGTNGAETEESIRLRMVLLPDFGKDGNEQRGINYRNQGFYILRNNREIAAGETFGLFTKDPHLNRVRGEIYFTGVCDEVMGVNFTKSKDLAPQQSILDKIAEVTRPLIRSLRKKADALRKTDQAKEVSHQESERLISQKGHLLVKPKPEVVCPPPTTRKKKENGRVVDCVVTTEPRERLRTLCRFVESSLGRTSPIYDAYMEGRKLIITWNIDHPFYERFVLERREDKTLLTSVDFLVYSMASAELTTRSDENVQLIENIKTIMSTNLRSLLS